MVTIPSILIILLYNTDLFYVFQIFNFAGFSFSMTEIMISVLILTTSYQFIFLGRKFSIPDKKIVMSIIGLIVAMLLSLIGLFGWGGYLAVNQFIKTMSHFLFVVSVGFILLGTDIKVNTFYYALRLILVMSILINLYAIYQLFARMFGLPWAYVDISNAGYLTRDYGVEVGKMNQIVLSFENFYRATSIFSEPSALAWFNITNLIYVIIPYITKTKPFIPNKPLNIIITILSIISLFLTFSLTGLVLGTLFLLLILIFEKVSYKKLAVSILVVIVVIIGSDNYLKDFTQISIVDLFTQRVTGLISQKKSASVMTMGESAPQRVGSFVNAWHLFLTSPIFGIGTGNTYRHPLSTVKFSDSTFFHVLAETGLVGMFFYLCILYYTLKMAIFLRKYRFKYGEITPELSTMQVVIFPFIILVIFTNTFMGNLIGNFTFWMQFGIVFAVYRATLREHLAKHNSVAEIGTSGELILTK